VEPVPLVRLTGGDFRLQAEDVSRFYSDLCEGLVVQELFATGAVVDFVAQGLPIGGVLGEIHFLQQDCDETVYWRVVGHFYFLTLVSCGVPNLYVHHSHDFGIPDLARMTIGR
jgi:hypothetical protein